MLNEVNLKNKTLKRMISFNMLNEWKENYSNYKESENSRIHMVSLMDSTVQNAVC